MNSLIKSRKVGKQAPRSRQSAAIARTGIPSLDQILQGGFLIGSVVVLNQDLIGNYAVQTARCFAAEGENGQDIVSCYSQEELQEFVPKIRKVSHKKSGDLRIAWRYEGMQHCRVTGQYVFDISRFNENANVSMEVTDFSNLESLFERIMDTLQEGLESENDTKIRRVYIHQLLRDCVVNSTQSLANVYRFFISLKKMIRSLNCVCLITIPMKLLDEKMNQVILELSDLCLNFQDLDQIKLGEYSGIMTIQKQPSLDSFKEIHQISSSYGVVSDQRNFLIEKFTLPPEGGENKPSSLDF